MKHRTAVNHRLLLPATIAFLCPLLAGNDGRAQGGPASPAEGALAAEVRDRGWIIHSAPSGSGDWDLFLMRPDGSGRVNLTNSPETSEAGGRFSPDGKRLLYYRMPRSEPVDNNKYGAHELIVANADGTGPQVLGDGFSWASWGPDGTQLACLSRQGITVVDLASRRTLRKLGRRGFVEQLVWSPDGKSFVGTANGLGEHWAIGRMDASSGELNRVSDGDCFNCTPDWFPDARRVVYSKGHPLTEGWAQLWTAGPDGNGKRMLYGEIGRHIYGGAISPDGKYVLFTRSQEDLGQVDQAKTEMALIRLEDTPMVGGGADSDVLRRQYPNARGGPVLHLSRGWEPHWTAAKLDVPGAK